MEDQLLLPPANNVAETIEVKKKPGVQKGVKRGGYKKKFTENNPPVETFKAPENQPHVTEKYNSPKELLDDIEDLGRANFEAHLNANTDNTPEDKTETKDNSIPLDHAYIDDDNEFTEDPNAINPDAEKEDPNNEEFSGTIIFMVWDLFVPGVVLWLYNFTASPETKAKLKKIKRDSLSLTDEQKEELEKSGLAAGISRKLFANMDPMLAFLLKAMFFTFMNLKQQLNNMEY